MLFKTRFTWQYGKHDLFASRVANTSKEPRQINIDKITTIVKQKGTSVSKMKCQKEKKQAYKTFAYKLLYSVIKVCAHSAATKRFLHD